MKNLQNYSVQELSINETIKIEGGGPILSLVSAPSLHAIVDFFSGAIDRFNEHRKK